MSGWKNISITNIVFSFLSVTIIPISVFVPVGLWIPLVFSAIVLFCFENKKTIYLNINSNIEILLLLFLAYAGLSLIWTINLLHAKEFFFHLLVLYLSFKILIVHSSKITNLNKIKTLLFYSFNLSSIIAICDMHFYLGAKSMLTYLFELVFTQKDIWSFSFTELNNYRLQVKDGMFSGVYNRGLSFSLVFGFILCNIFYNKKLHLSIILLNFSTLILVGESFSVQIILYLSLFIIFLLKFFKRLFVPIFTIVISLYFILSPLLLNITNESKWSNDHYITSIEIRKLKDTKTTDLLMANYKDIRNVAKKSYLTFKSKILHRTMIWSYTSDKIKENIFFGKGLFSSRKLGETHTIELVDKTRDNKIILYPSIPLHPHNSVLQIWLELGIIGVFLYLSLHLFIWFFLCKKLKLNNIKDIITALPFFSVLIINQISFGAFQTWWLAATAYFVIFINIFLKTKSN